MTIGIVAAIILKISGKNQSFIEEKTLNETNNTTNLNDSKSCGDNMRSLSENHKSIEVIAIQQNSNGDDHKNHEVCGIK